MADGRMSGQCAEVQVVKNVCNEAVGLMAEELTVVVDSDTCGGLASVLQ